jgi:riboflavin kinase/FMN adenylyltransferase
MLLARDELARSAPGQPCALTLGVFDGVHRGHLHLIEVLKRRAEERGLASGVVTLHPSPIQVLRPQIRIAYLTSLEERIELLRLTEVDAVAPLTFTSEVAELTAREFLQLLRDALDMRYLLMGPDNAFGRAREGTPERVGALTEELGFQLGILDEPLHGADGRVSATAIRHAIADGNMETAARLLGRSYALRGPVIRGDERGRAIGFPTANMAMTPDRAIPADGVYVTRAHVAGGTFMGATNVGMKPTFDDERPAIETYLLDFEGDIYARELRIEFLHRLRGVVKFVNVEALIEAIRADVEAARAYFARHPA